MFWNWTLSLHTYLEQVSRPRDMLNRPRKLSSSTAEIEIPFLFHLGVVFDVVIT